MSRKAQENKDNDSSSQTSGVAPCFYSNLKEKSTDFSIAKWDKREAGGFGTERARRAS